MDSIVCVDRAHVDHVRDILDRGELEAGGPAGRLPLRRGHARGQPHQPRPQHHRRTRPRDAGGGLGEPIAILKIQIHFF